MQKKISLNSSKKKFVLFLFCYLRKKITIKHIPCINNIYTLHTIYPLLFIKLSGALSVLSEWCSYNTFEGYFYFIDFIYFYLYLFLKTLYIQHFWTPVIYICSKLLLLALKKGNFSCQLKNRNVTRFCFQ